VRAVVVDRPGEGSVLRVAEVPSPELRAGCIRIRVAATAVNRADLLQRRGLYPPPEGASELLGLECAGTVAEVGDGVDRWAVGDRVMALLPGGGYAEEAVVQAGAVLAVPPGMPLESAAAVPEVFLTAFLNLFRLGGLAARETALVHGGSGGVGTASIQLIRRAGARCIVTAGGPERTARCLDLGADHAVDHRRGALLADLREILADGAVDVVLDCIGAPYLGAHLEVLATDGRLVLIGLMGGRRAEIDLGAVLRKRLRLVGSTLRSRSAAEKAEIVDDFLRRFGRDLAEGVIGPVVDRVLPLEEAAEGHRALASGEPFGKVVLRLETSGRPGQRCGGSSLPSSA